MQIGNRLFILCLFGHQWYGSDHLSGLLGFLLAHIVTMFIFNIIFSDLCFLEEITEKTKFKYYILEMTLNAFGCAFIHNWIKLNRENRFNRTSLLRQVVFETFMFMQNCMLIVLALTLENEDSLLNLEIHSRKGEIAGVCFCAFFWVCFLRHTITTVSIHGQFFEIHYLIT